MSDEQRTAKKITDAVTMRAVAHPTRLALLEALGKREPLTATEAADIIGESPTNCAFHLRTLAKYGFIEEAGDAPGRRRPWRRKHIGFQFDTSGADNETYQAGEVLAGVLWERWLKRLEVVNIRRPMFDRTWARLTNGMETPLFLTPEEAETFFADLSELFNRHNDRLADAELRPEGCVPIEFLAFSYPLDAIRPGDT